MQVRIFTESFRQLPRNTIMQPYETHKNYFHIYEYYTQTIVIVTTGFSKYAILYEGKSSVM
jgi:hypothetical protein